MAGLSFSVFKDKILDGSKRQTIRAIRKNPIKEGETLYLWWKQRSPERKKLGNATCESVRKVVIYEDHILCEDCFFPDQYELIDHPDSLQNFAIADGFEGWNDLLNFFQHTHGLPFKGVLIEWDGIISDPDPELVEALNDWSFRTDYRGNDENGSLRVQVQIC